MTHPVSRLKMAADDVPEFTLVVCVREPAVLLAETLRTLEEMRVPSVRSWEVLVVGYSAVNESESLRSLSEPVVTIPACHIVDRFADQLPVRWVEGSDVGIHSARRRAVDASRGDWIIFTEGDVHIQREQATLEYLRDFYFRLGLARAGSSDAERSLSRPWLKALRSECLFQVTRAIGRANWWVKPMREASCRWGLLRGMTRPTPQSLAPNSSPPSVRRAA